MVRVNLDLTANGTTNGTSGSSVAVRTSIDTSVLNQSINGFTNTMKTFEIETTNNSGEVNIVTFTQKDGGDITDLRDALRSLENEGVLDADFINYYKNEVNIQLQKNFDITTRQKNESGNNESGNNGSGNNGSGNNGSGNNGTGNNGTPSGGRIDITEITDPVKLQAAVSNFTLTSPPIQGIDAKYTPDSKPLNKMSKRELNSIIQELENKMRQESFSESGTVSKTDKEFYIKALQQKEINRKNREHTMSRVATNLKYILGMMGVMTALGTVAGAFTTDEKEQLENLFGCLYVCMPIVENNKLQSNPDNEINYMDRFPNPPVCNIEDDYESIKVKSGPEIREEVKEEKQVLLNDELGQIKETAMDKLNDDQKSELREQIKEIRIRLQSLETISKEDIRIYKKCEAYCTRECIKAHIYNCDVIKKPYTSVLKIPSNILQGNELLPDCDMEEFGKDFGYGVGNFVVGTATGALKGGLEALPKPDLTWLWITLAIAAVLFVILPAGYFVVTRNKSSSK